MKTKIAIIGMMLFIFLLVPIGVKASDGQVVEESTVNLYEEPFVINGELVLEQGAVTPEGERYYHLEELVNRLGGEISFLAEKIAIQIDEKDLLGLGLHEAEITPFIEPVAFEEVVNAHAAVLIEGGPTQVLFSKNKEEKLYPASTTKIMTALVALENGDLTDLVTVTEEVIGVPWDSSKAHIRPGDVLTLEQLLYAMMIPSGNDAAVAIATHIAGSEEKFAELMNEKAQEVGATNTNFVNSHGYHDEEQLTTALDLAKIAYAASQVEGFYPLVSTYSFGATYKNSEGNTVRRTWRATNQQLNRNSPYYSSGMISGKTGFTTPSGHTLVSFAEREGHQYITVILKGNRNARYSDTERLIDRAVAMRSAYDEERKVPAELLEEEFSVLINGAEVAAGQLAVVENAEIYFSLDAFIEHKAEVKNEIIRKNKLELALDQMYFPNKYFFQQRGQLFVPFRSPFIAYHMATTFHNRLDAVDTGGGQIQVAAVEKTGASQ